MFAFLAVLLGLALAVFGATPEHARFLIEILCLVGVLGLLLRHLFRFRGLNWQVLALAGACLGSSLLDAKLTIAMFAIGWSAIAARQSTAKALGFFRFLVLLGFLEALLGLVQYFVAPGWILGYQNPYYPVSGTLINKNHFAGLLEMLIPVTLGFGYIAALKAGNTAKAWFYVLSGAFFGVALVFSFSRMGIFAFLVTVLALGAILRFKGGGRGTASKLALALIGLVAIGAIWVGVTGIASRYATLGGEDAVLQEGRVVVFWDTIRLIADHPWGVGAGKYQDAFRPYQNFRLDLTFDHAHNDYLENAAEWGIVPSLAFWGFIVLVYIRALRRFLNTDSIERGGILIACLGGVFSIALHGLADFNLQIPSNSMLFFSFVGIAIANSATISNQGAKSARVPTSMTAGT